MCITGRARDVAVDDVNGYIYWCNGHTIYRIDMDGSNQKTVVKILPGKAIG